MESHQTITAATNTDPPTENCRRGMGKSDTQKANILANHFANSLMFVPCIIRRSRNNQHYAQICTIPLFYILAPTCFGISVQSSGSFLDSSELLKIQIELVIYHIMCGYVACVSECRGSVCCASQLGSTTAGTTKLPARFLTLLNQNTTNTTRQINYTRSPTWIPTVTRYY
jgi:hypothetical protein